jgi:hypothetical protein
MLLVQTRLRGAMSAAVSGPHAAGRPRPSANSSAKSDILSATVDGDPSRVYNLSTAAATTSTRRASRSWCTRLGVEEVHAARSRSRMGGAEATARWRCDDAEIEAIRSPISRRRHCRRSPIRRTRLKLALTGFPQLLRMAWYQNVRYAEHKQPGLCGGVTLSLKPVARCLRATRPPSRWTWLPISRTHMRLSEVRVGHEQNLASCRMSRKRRSAWRCGVRLDGDRTWRLPNVRSGHGHHRLPGARLLRAGQCAFDHRWRRRSRAGLPIAGHGQR